MKRLVLPAIILSLCIPGAVLADPPPGKGRAHANNPPGTPKGPPATPPGLARKPYGMPPGQVRKWQRGQRLPAAYYTQRTYYIVRPAQYNLPPAPAGQRWVLVDDTAYRVNTTTGVVAQVVAALLR